MSVVASRLSAFFVEAETVSRFIRFGEPPTSGRSKVWQAPTVFHTSQQGTDLLGLSVYEARRQGRNWRIVTDNLHTHGMSSLADLLYDAVQEKPDRKTYLLKGRFLRWGHISKEERRNRDDQGYARDPVIGTDGEYLLRDYQIIGEIDPWLIVAPAVGFPEDYRD